MQILLNEFQYKSVSSLYKMLRQRMSGTMRTFKEHYLVCKYELVVKIPDPITATSSEEILTHLQTYTAKEYMNADILIKGTALRKNLTYLKELMKWFCKLFYSFSFTCFVVELFHFVYDVHANYVTHTRIMISCQSPKSLLFPSRTICTNLFFNWIPTTFYNIKLN